MLSLLSRVKSVAVADQYDAILTRLIRLGHNACTEVLTYQQVNGIQSRSANRVTSSQLHAGRIEEAKHLDRIRNIYRSSQPCRSNTRKRSPYGLRMLL